MIGLTNSEYLAALETADSEPGTAHDRFVRRLEIIYAHYRHNIVEHGEQACRDDCVSSRPDYALDTPP
jgi:hypothetical protein